jgi:hypothetical protein
MLVPVNVLLSYLEFGTSLSAYTFLNDSQTAANNFDAK